MEKGLTLWSPRYIPSSRRWTHRRNPNPCRSSLTINRQDTVAATVRASRNRRTDEREKRANTRAASVDSTFPTFPRSIQSCTARGRSLQQVNKEENNSRHPLDSRELLFLGLLPSAAAPSQEVGGTEPLIRKTRRSSSAPIYLVWSFFFLFLSHSPECTLQICSPGITSTGVCVHVSSDLEKRKKKKWSSAKVPYRKAPSIVSALLFRQKKKKISPVESRYFLNRFNKREWFIFCVSFSDIFLKNQTWMTYFRKGCPCRMATASIFNAFSTDGIKQ